MEVGTVGALIEKFGVAIAMLMVFIYFDVKRRKKDDSREAALAVRLAAVEDYQRNRLEKMVVENTTASQNQADASRELKEAAQQQSLLNRQMILALRTRPCLEAFVDELQHSHQEGIRP